MNSQLFHELPPIKVPHSGVKLRNSTHVTTQVIPAFPYMYWPSGKPCEPINMYFLDIACEVTGNSLRTYATLLSHLVRYCGKESIKIESLTDAHIYTLSDQLQAEKKRHNPLERARNDNTVCDILSRIISFLLWYQKNFMLPLRPPLIGEHDVSPQITVKRIKNDRGRSKNRRLEYYYIHSAMPTKESREPKRPIAAPVIEDIQRCINRKSLLNEQSPYLIRRYCNKPSLLVAQLEYMRVRRHFVLWMMMHTGLRPSELVEISVKEHEDILTTRTLKIPTKKRRKIKAPKRSFPLFLNAATVVHRYLISRSKYCEALKEFGGEPNPSDAFFLTQDGKPILKSSLEKDFERLTIEAGYKSIQACFSMFRHRFITYEVIAHLKEFINQTGKTRQMMTDVDYESILKRIATKTGHGSVQSLWYYIDLAWKELDVWGSIDKAITRLHAAGQLFTELLALQMETKTLSTRQTNRKIELNQIIDRLGEILSVAQQDIEPQELHGKQRLPDKRN